MSRFFIKLFASGFGAGYVPYITGTAGTLVGIPVFLMLSCHCSGPACYFFATVFLTLFAIWIAHKALPLYNDPKKPKDAAQIVVDEVVGFLWAAGVLQYLGFWNPKEGLLSFLILSVGFFRLFDITKWGPVGWAERRLKGGFAIVMDDVVAGVLAGFSAILFCVFYPLVVYFFVR